MTKNKIHSASIFILSMAVVACLPFAAAWAVCSATCAVTENSRLDFGTAAKPSSGSQTIIVNAQTGAVSGTGTVLYGTPAAGSYTVTRTGATTGCASTTLNVNNLGAGTGLTLSNMSISYNGGASNAAPRNLLSTYPATTGTAMGVGGKLTVDSTASTGSTTLALDVVCTIQ